MPYCLKRPIQPTQLKYLILYRKKKEKQYVDFIFFYIDETKKTTSSLSWSNSVTKSVRLSKKVSMSVKKREKDLN